MKTLFGKLKYVVLAATVALAIFTFRAFAQTPSADKKFVLNIGRTTEDYVDLRDKNAFDRALNDLKNHGGQYEIRFKPDHGNVIDHYQPVSIKTDKVTTSEVAQNAPAGESAANDPSVTTHLSSDSATDIKSVLDTFK